MSILMSCIVVAYAVVGFLVNIAMQREYKKDRSGDLDEFNPLFIKISLVATALCWPLLVVIVTYQAFKKG